MIKTGKIKVKSIENEEKIILEIVKMLTMQKVTKYFWLFAICNNMHL